MRKNEKEQIIKNANCQIKMANKQMKIANITVPPLQQHKVCEAGLARVALAHKPTFGVT